MYKWYLPTLSEIIGSSELPPASAAGSDLRQKAERQWSGSIAALNLSLQAIDWGNATDQSLQERGLVLSGPVPVLQPEMAANVSAWTFTPEPLGALAWMPFHLLPATEPTITTLATSTLPLLPNDPLAAEQFCLVLTPAFSLVLALGEVANSAGQDQPAFLFSFDPEVVWQAWRSLRSRLMLTSPQVLGELDKRVEQFPPIAPDYQTVTQFSRLLLAHLPSPIEWEPVMPPKVAKATLSVVPTVDRHSSGQRDRLPDTSLETLAQGRTDADIELLQAIAHEVRTPLTTIRTLTRLLLKRQDLSLEVLKRLKLIDQECTDQIDRFSLIFRAVELEAAQIKRPLSPLAAISLAQVFQENVPRWQQQASQRNLTLEVILPQKLPLVVSDPAMLEQMLTGLFDRITHTLAPGSHIQVRVMLAGHQLKLQFQTHPQATSDEGIEKTKSVWTPTLKAIGQLLMFQPETGNLSLNLSVTKNLFQALGGKLTVRQRPQQGEVLTVFLPLETRKFDD